MRKRTITNRQMWRLWMGIKQRCYNPNNKDFKHYGARGIALCQRWQDFNNFLSDMGIKPDGMCLDRIDNSKGYSPENCRWATMQEQSNNRVDNAFLTFNGKTQTYAQWEREVGLSHGMLRNRLVRCGWPVEKALKP